MKGLLKPFKWVVESCNEFNILEPDLLPLLDHIPMKESFYIDPNHDDDWVWKDKDGVQHELP